MTHRPNIWSFLDSLDEILCDFDLEYGRLYHGLEMSYRGEETTQEQRKLTKQMKKETNQWHFYPLEYLIGNINSTIGKQSYYNAKEKDIEG